MRFQDQSFAQRERSILDAALHLFQQQPWDRLTIAEVAEHARIGKGTVYKHFPSKEALYAQLVLEFSRSNLQQIQQQAALLAPTERLRAVIRQAFSEMLADPVMTQLWMHCDRPDFRQRLTPEMQQAFVQLDELYQQVFIGLLGDLLYPLQLAESPLNGLLWALEASFLGVMARISNGSLACCDASFEVEDYFDQVADFIIAGLQGQAAHLSLSPSSEKV